MEIIYASLACFFLFGVLSLLTSRSPKLASILGVTGTVIGSISGLSITVYAILTGPLPIQPIPMHLPLTSFHLGIDALSAFFLLLIFVLSPVFAIFGASYLYAYRQQKALGIPWFFFNILVASMAIVVMAQNALLFLMAWEVMAISSFFLVVFEGEKPAVRDAGITYLIATHLGTAFLVVMFILIGNQAGSFDFSQFTGLYTSSPTLLNIIFLCALVGFGTKAGIMPMHVWLPQAHPAAPSHVSALMSAVMIKTGIYGLMRIFTLMGTPPSWWGWLLIGVGFVSAVGGILCASAQQDIKRTLAYSSIENIGIIVLGMGLGVLGRSCGSSLLTLIGLLGAMFHMLNHAIYKGLLFLGAGAIYHATHTREIDRLGGLYKKMPRTGLCFLVGVIAISGLFPLNGFVSEFLLYIGALGGAFSLHQPDNLYCLLVILGLVLVGGIASACFAKVFGIVFLGEPRDETTPHNKTCEPGPLMLVPMMFLAMLCFILGIGSPIILSALTRLASSMGIGVNDSPDMIAPLYSIVGATLVFLVLCFALLLFRKSLLSKRKVETEVTWDCGYAKPSSRMQYTASSFAEPMLQLFYMVTSRKKNLTNPLGYFPLPRSSSFISHAPDWFQDNIYAPSLRIIDKQLAIVRRFQHGKMQLYILCIALVLIFILVWQLGIRS